MYDTEAFGIVNGAEGKCVGINPRGAFVKTVLVKADVNRVRIDHQNLSHPIVVLAVDTVDIAGAWAAPPQEEDQQQDRECERDLTIAAHLVEAAAEVVGKPSDELD